MRTLSSSVILVLLLGSCGLKGDIYTDKGSTSEARAAYKMAMNKTEKKETRYKIIQMKLDALKK